MTRETENDLDTKKNKKEKKPKKERDTSKKHIGGIASLSFIISLFDKLWEIICGALVNGFWGRICSFHSKLENNFAHGFLQEFMFSDKRFKKIFRKIRRFLSYNIDNCFIVKQGNRVSSFFVSAPLYYYGNFGFFFGLYTIVVFFVKRIIPEIESSGAEYLVFGIAMIIISLPLMFSKLSLANAIMNSSIAKAIAQGCLGLSEDTLSRNVISRKGRGNVMLFLGLVAGTLSFFIHPLKISLFLIVCIIVALVAFTPEIGVVLTAFIVPLCSFLNNPTITLCICVHVTAFFYLIKLIRGKRVFKLEIIDGFVLLFGIVIYLSSIFSAGGSGSKNAALVSCSLMLGYFLVVNLMRTEKWIKRCVAALISSGTAVAVIGIFEYFFGESNGEWLDSRLFAGIRTRVTSLFENPNVLSAYLVLLLPFALCYLVLSKTRNERFISGVVCACFACATILTWSRGAWIAMVAISLIFFAIFSQKTLRIFGVALLALPILPMVLPQNILDRAISILNFSDSSISYRIYTWIGSLRVIGDHFWGGIGFGPEAFSKIYPDYAYSGIEAAEHSHSLFLQILLGLGIGGLLTFVFMMFLFLQKCSEYIKSPENRASKLYVSAAFVSAIGSLIMGIFDYIWFNYRVFYVFWLVLAIGCAFIRIGKNEIERKTEITNKSHEILSLNTNN